jgi:hypothetical protein
VTRAPALPLVLLLAAAAAAGDGPGEGCAVCHGKEKVLHAASVHAPAGVGCVACHGGDPAAREDRDAAHAAAMGFRSKPGRAASSETCAACHADAARVAPFGIRTDASDAWREGRHGPSAPAKEGRTGADCLHCHGAHDVVRASDPRSPVHRDRQGATCGSCHGAEASALAHGPAAGAPRCADCHDAHAARPPAGRAVGALCGACHRDALDAFRKGPHFGASAEGKPVTCATCHGNHAVAAPGHALLDGPPTAGAPGAGRSCASCHDPAKPGDRAAAAGPAVARDLRAAEALVAETAARVEEVAARGFFLEDERAALVRARAHLRAALPAIHGADSAPFDGELRRARSLAESAARGAATREREERDRRLLGSFGGVVLLGIGAFLALRRRRNAAGEA